MTTAVQKEAGWLAAYNPADGLPGLLTANGGLLDVVAAYHPRTFPSNKRTLYVCYAETVDQRTGMQQAIATHRLRLKVRWPISATTATAESAQANLENVVAAAIARVRGLVGDHTHGGVFLSAAEGVTAEDQDARIHVTYEDPEHAIASGAFTAVITYTVDDLERSV